MKDLDDIYFTSRELPPEDRAAYLDKVCGGDAALRKRVEQMLAVAGEAESFIPDLPDLPRGERRPGKHPGQASKSESAASPDEAIGQRIGRYKILERVGEGGFGVVYVAEQTEPVRRRVALKVIKLGMDTRQVVARFEAERQALAMMDHPNIARVLDAGATEAGRPYFVMELVRGIQITDYCDKSNLNTKDRLDLFIKVCQGIQHAHQKGIIHRDIKPSNILVTLHDGVPVPKVIDFGIAKAIEGRLTDATVYTQLQQFIGTPAYISPEQAEMSGLDIDTRSDIYSLGVLLYELLAGSTPFDAKELAESGLDAMRKTIREQEPVRPSTKLAGLKVAELTTAAKRRSTEPPRLLHQLRGDLDWIVMKCLEKDRRRRYETANGLVADLNRHLVNEPVVACPPSALYRFQKSFRRNKIVYLAAFAVMGALLLGTVGSTWQAVEATRARKAEFRQRVAAQEAQAQAATLQKKAEAERQRAEDQLTRAEWLVYASKLMLAQTDFESGNGGLTPHYLEESQPNLRGWEYRYLRTRIEPRFTLAGHTREIYGVAFSPDGQRVITASHDLSARVWDATTGQELFALKGHKYWLTGAAFSPDGQRIVTGASVWPRSGGAPTEAKIWDAQTGQELLSLKTSVGIVHSVVFSPDGTRIAIGSGDPYKTGAATIFDARTGEKIHAFPAKQIHGVAFSPDGRRLAAASSDETAHVWDTETGQELLTIKGHSRGLRGVAFSPDSRRIATTSADQTARVWDATTGRELLVLRGHSDAVSCVAFSPDGKRIITGSWDQTVRVWDARTGSEIFALKGHASLVRGVEFSSDGRRIVTCSSDHTAKIWDAETGQDVPVLTGHIDGINSIVFSPDNKRIVTGSGDGTARVWDTRTAREILVLKPSNSRLWTEVALWGVGISPDGERIVTASQDHTARVWNASTGQQLFVLPHERYVSCAEFSPDGQHILTGTGEFGRIVQSQGVAKVWDARSGQELLAIPHTYDVWSVAYSPDGKRILTGGGDKTATVWNAATGGELLKLTGHTASIHRAVFSPDGKRIVTGSRDHTVKIWDASTGQETLTLKGHTDVVRNVAFSPDGRRVVSVCDDRTARIWEAGIGLELLCLKGFTHGVRSVAFSPDGQRIATGIEGLNATAKIWFSPPPKP